MRRIVLTYGFIAGAIMAAMLLITLFNKNIDFDRGAIVGYTSMVLAFLMVFFGVRTYRDSIAGGRVTFGKALRVGLLITAVATACYVATWELVFYKLSPDFSDKYAAYSLEKARKSGATEAQLAEQAKRLDEFKQAYRNPLVNIAYTALEPMPVGLLFTIIAAGALSRKRRSREADATA